MNHQYKTTQPAEYLHYTADLRPCRCYQWPMFINGVEVISSRLNNIVLESDFQENMRPNTEKPPTCGANKLPPLLHLTPSTNTQRRDGSPLQNDNPCLLKPQHDIPPTPPPQTDPKPNNFFPQKIG